MAKRQEEDRASDSTRRRKAEARDPGIAQFSEHHYGHWPRRDAGRMSQWLTIRVSFCLSHRRTLPSCPRLANSHRANVSLVIKLQVLSATYLPLVD